MQRIGIYGGTFNPPHIGHVQAATQAYQALGLQKLLLIPDSIAPHKILPEGTPTPEQRCEMIRLAAEDCPGLEISDLELQRPGISYTCETVAQLRQEYPEDQLCLIVGSDMFLSFETWKNYESLLKTVTLAVLCRGNRGEKEKIQVQKANLEAQGGRIQVIDNVITDISSTQVRRLLAFGCRDAFLCPKVAQYIEDHGLYQVHRDFKNLSMEDLENAAEGLMKPKRFHHAKGVRDTAIALAERWGENIVDAGRAGMLHDITKALDGPLQLTLCGAYDKMLDDFSMENPKTLHAYTGAIVARDIFGENPEVVSAIRCHTTGKTNMNLLETILYVADYMEPGRDFPGVEKLRELAFTDLYGALKLGMEMTLDHLKEQGSTISPATKEALDWLNIHL